MLTDNELRQAVFALGIIEAQGSSGEWAGILAKST